jgi:hypothetical protein
MRAQLMQVSEREFGFIPLKVTARGPDDLRFASERALGASGIWFCGFSTLRARRAFDLGAVLKGRIRAAFERLAISGMGCQLFRPTGVYFALHLLGPMSVKRGNGS